MKQINTIIFDFDGTICDSLNAGFEIVNELADEFKFKKVSREELPEFRNMNSKMVIKSLGISYFKLPWLAKRFRSKLNTKISALKPIYNVSAEITKLHRAGYTLGIISSNSSENINEFLDNNGLALCFSFLHAETGLFGKSSVIKKLLRQQNLSKRQVLLLGDETRDIIAAQRCGIQMMAVTWGFHTKALLENYAPDYLVDKTSEIYASINRDNGLEN